MAKIDAYEKEILTAFEKGCLKSVASKGELQKLTDVRIGELDAALKSKEAEILEV